MIEVITDNAILQGNLRLVDAKEKEVILDTLCSRLHEFDVGRFWEESVTPRRDNTSGKKIITHIYSRTTLICLLQKFTKGTDLIRLANTHFVTFYLTLRCLIKNKWLVIRMFTSKKRESSQVVNTIDGNLVAILILDKGFRNLFWIAWGVHFP